MVNKNKNNTNFETSLRTVADSLSMFVVGIATVINISGLSHGEQAQPSDMPDPGYAVIQSHESATAGGEMRRAGREEIRHTSASYGNIMRSPNTAGSI